IGAGEVLDVADQERSAAGTGPAPLAEGDDALTTEVLEILLRAQHRTSKWMIAKRGLVDQALGDHRWLVEGAVDLLDHDAPPRVEPLAAEVRTATKSLSRSIAADALSARTVMWKATR